MAQVGSAVVPAHEVAFLKALDRRLLLELLEPFAGALACAGLDLNIKSNRQEWLGQLHAAIRSRDGNLVRLQELLVQLEEVSSSAGHEFIIEEAVRREVDLFGQGSGVVARQNVALATWLRHPEVFLAAHARCVVKRRRKFVRFAHAGHATPIVSQTVLEMAQAQIVSRFRQQNRTATCRVAWDEEIAEVSLLVRHGAVTDRLGRRDVDYVASAQDTVIYEQRTGHLSIAMVSSGAMSSADCELYRSTMGGVLAGDPALFQPLEVFSGEPLLQLGSRALDASDVRGIKRVMLLSIMVTRDGASRNLVMQGADIAAWLDEERAAKTLEGGTVAMWRLGIVMTDGPSILEVEFEAPNLVRADTRISTARLLEFLQARGFVVGLPCRRGLLSDKGSK